MSSLTKEEIEQIVDAFDDPETEKAFRSLGKRHVGESYHQNIPLSEIVKYMGSCKGYTTGVCE